MDESLGSSNNDNSLLSKETTFSTISALSSSFESQCPISSELKKKIIDAVAINLHEIILENKQNNDEKYIKNDIFYLSKIPPISLIDYIKRLVKYTRMDISSLILAIIYIDRFCESRKYILTYNNIYRILLSTCLLSIKFNEDIYFNYKKYSEIAGVSIEDLNNLELYMYFELDYSLYVDSDFYQKYFKYFSKYIKAKDDKDYKVKSADC